MDPHTTDRQPLSGPVRSLLALAAVGLLAILGVARWLEPDPRGHGTHTQLGLAPCAFATLTGRPCPSCGMTTSFAWFARGRWLQSLRVHPVGFAMAALSAPLAVWLFLCSWSKKPVGFRSVDKPLIGLLVSIVAASLAFWFIRILGAQVNLNLAGPMPVFGPR